MIVVGSFDAKTHLPQLIEKVRKGETVQITRHGVPVAKLVPVDKKPAISQVIEELREFRKGKKLDGVTITELISEGRE